MFPAKLPLTTTRHCDAGGSSDFTWHHAKSALPRRSISSNILAAYLPDTPDPDPLSDRLVLHGVLRHQRSHARHDHRRCLGLPPSRTHRVRAAVHHSHQLLARSRRRHACVDHGAVLPHHRTIRNPHYGGFLEPPAHSHGDPLCLFRHRRQSRAYPQSLSHRSGLRRRSPRCCSRLHGCHRSPQSSRWSNRRHSLRCRLRARCSRLRCQRHSRRAGPPESRSVVAPRRTHHRRTCRLRFPQLPRPRRHSPRARKIQLRN